MSTGDALTWRNWANLVAYVVNLAVTYASQTGIFGKTNTDLSKKYQTLVTPAGFAFAIWGPIFIWEGVFAVSQMLARWRGSKVVQTVTPWWISACVFQCLWTFAFAQEGILLALICMLGILGSLVGAILKMDCLPSMTGSEFWLLRSPFSLHGGWIIAASAVNASVLADRFQASPEVQLGLAIVTFGVIQTAVALFAFAAPKPEAIVGFVACWALVGVYSELGQATNLKDPRRYNFYDWPEVDLRALRLAALVLSIASLACGVAAATCRALGTSKKPEFDESTALRVGV